MSSEAKPSFNKIAYSVAEVLEIAGCSNGFLYEEINAGKLRAVKRGRRTLILAGDLEAWINSWPEYQAADINGKAKVERYDY